MAELKVGYRGVAISYLEIGYRGVWSLPGRSIVDDSYRGVSSLLLDEMGYRGVRNL